MLLTIIVIKNFKCYQMNVSNTFTEASFKHNIFMQTSLNYDILEKMILKVDRNLYDLKQVIRDWHDVCLKTLINDLKFQRFPADSYVFTIYV